MKKLAVLFVVLASALLAGCAGTAKEYVEADRATYEAIAPDHLKYIDADPALHNADGTLNKDGKLAVATVDSWRYRLEQAEKADK